MLRAVVLTQYRRVTDGQTDGPADGIAVASTALAMRALWRAAKKQSKIRAKGIRVLRKETRSTRTISRRVEITQIDKK